MPELDKTRVEALIAETSNNSKYFEDITNQLVAQYSQDLDNIMQDLKKDVTGPQSITTDELERYYAELSNLIYFMSEKLEQLNINKDMSKAASKEVYNRFYLAGSAEKDEKGKSVRTVNENVAYAENASQYEAVVSNCYEHAYKIMNNKVLAAQEMVSTLKYILKRRTQEEYMIPSSPSQKAAEAAQNPFFRSEGIPNGVIPV